MLLVMSAELIWSLTLTQQLNEDDNDDDGGDANEEQKKIIMLTFQIVCFV